MLFRSVLSRAELDALPLDNNLKDDVERGKVISGYSAINTDPPLYWQQQGKLAIYNPELFCPLRSFE